MLSKRRPTPLRRPTTVRRWLPPPARGDVIIRDHRNLREPGAAAVRGRDAPVAIPWRPRPWRRVAVGCVLATESLAATDAVDAVSEKVMIRRRISPALQEMILAGSLEAIVAGQATRPEARTQTVVGPSPSSSSPSDEQNGPIYRSLHGAANLSEDWAHGEAGWLCESVFPNTVNRLPDAMRIAWNPRVGGRTWCRPAPHPGRYAAGASAAAAGSLPRPRQRVLARKIVGMPAATVVIGEVQGSTLKLAGSFPKSSPS